MTEDRSFYDRKGQPITTLEWADLFKNPKYRFIRTSLTPRKQYKIITIWNGVDETMGLHPKKLIFYTAIFVRVNEKKFTRFFSNRQAQYTLAQELGAATEREALEDHKQLLEEWSEKERWSR